MNRVELAAELARYIGATKVEVEAVVNATFKIITDTLAVGDKVRIDNFGTFEVKNRAPRVGRNPRANLPVNIPARRAPSFTAHKTLKDTVGCGK